MIVLVPKSDAINAQPRGYQLHHLAFEVPEAQFDAQYQTFIDAGLQPRSGKHPVLASCTMYVDDPDGNEVEFICQAPAV